MEGSDKEWGVETDISLLSVCVVLAGCLTWVVKRLLGVITNDLKHIKESLAKLPCGEHTRQLGRHDVELKELKEREV